jgi:chloride channel 7
MPQSDSDLPEAGRPQKDECNSSEVDIELKDYTAVRTDADDNIVTDADGTTSNDRGVTEPKKISFSMTRWGEAHSTGDMVAQFDYRRAIPWLRILVIGLGVGLVECLPVIALASLITVKFDAVYDAQEDHGLGMMVLVIMSICLVSTIIGSVVVLLFSPAAAGSGLPGICAYFNSGYLTNLALFSPITVLTKAVSIVFVLTGGLCVGREGPAIHIGTGTAYCANQLMNYLFSTPFDGTIAHEAAVVGASCGFATAFGAPIGGMIYVWEELTAHWDNVRHASLGARCLLGVCVSSLVLKITLSVLTSKFNLDFNSIVIFDDDQGVYETKNWDWADLPIVITIGIVCGVLSGISTRLARKMYELNKTTPFLQSPGGKLAAISAIAVFTSICLSLAPLARPECVKDAKYRRLAGGGNRVFVQYDCDYGYHNELASLSMVGEEGAIRHLFARDDLRISPGSIAFFLFVYWPLTILPYGSIVPAGSFVPNLLIGACVGRFFGELLEDDAYASTGSPGVYAAIGAAAMLGGWTRTMMAIIITLGEITGDISLTLPLILATLISRQIARNIAHHSFTHALVDEIEHDDHSMVPAKWLDPQAPQTPSYKKRRESFVVHH